MCLQWSENKHVSGQPSSAAEHWALSPAFCTKMLQQANRVWLLRQKNPWLGPHLLATEAAGEGLVVARIPSPRSYIYN